MSPQAADSQQTASGVWHAYESLSGYFRTDAEVAFSADDTAACRPLERAIETLLDASLYAEDDVHAEGFLHASTTAPTGPDVPGSAAAAAAPGTFRHSVAGHRASDAPGLALSRGPWAPPDGVRPRTFEPIGCTNGWHIDDGSRPRAEIDFSLGSYMKALAPYGNSRPTLAPYGNSLPTLAPYGRRRG